jgi:hypothetical protein
MAVAVSATRRNTHVKRGQTLVVHAGLGVELEIERFASGAVEVRNAKTGKILRGWSPKEARER